MQSQCNSIKNNNDVELLLPYIKKLQNTTEVETFESNDIASWTKDAVSRKKVDVTIRKVICITG